jgi:hypothetical protein
MHLRLSKYQLLLVSNDRLKKKKLFTHPLLLFAMNSTEVCEVAALLAADPILRILLYFRVIVFIAGLILFAIFFKIEGSYLAFHRNARMLLMNSYLWAILQTITGLALNIFDIIRYSGVHQDPCEYTLSSPISALLRGPSIWTLCGSIWALLAMAVERCVASVTYRTYEKRSNGLGKLSLCVLVMGTLHF